MFRLIKREVCFKDGGVVFVRFSELKGAGAYILKLHEALHDFKEKNKNLAATLSSFVHEKSRRNPSAVLSFSSRSSHLQLLLRRPPPSPSSLPRPLLLPRRRLPPAASFPPCLRDSGDLHVFPAACGWSAPCSRSSTPVVMVRAVPVDQDSHQPLLPSCTFSGSPPLCDSHRQEEQHHPRLPPAVFSASVLTVERS